MKDSEQLAAIFTQKMQKGLFSERPHSIQEWEEIIAPFKNGDFRDQIPYGGEIHGYVFKEILPMLAVAKKLNSECSLHFLGPKLSTEDGSLFHHSLPNGIQGVQCVAAVDGYMDSIRMEKLKLHGHAEAYGDVEYSGTKHNRTISSNLNIIAYSPDDDCVINDFKNLIRDALRKKNDVKYKGLWLVICIDDYTPFRLSEDKDLSKAAQHFQSILSEDEFKHLANIFPQILLVGANTEKVIEGYSE